MATVATFISIRETMFLPVYYHPASSITIDQVSQIDKESSSWLTLIMCYLSSGELPDNRIKAHKIQVQAARCSLVNKQSLDWPYLRCLTTQQGQYILAELHEGICENHPGDRTLAHRAHKQGYYWLTMRTDAVTYVRKCDRCQRQALISRGSAQYLTTITNPWIFS